MDCENNTPPHIAEKAKDVIANLLPAKSSQIYNKTYHNFKKWCNEENVKNINENVLIAYFEELSKVKKSSSMWSIYSMLKSCLILKENINIKNYNNLMAFLKRNSKGYVAKKAKVFTLQQVENFLETAPNEEFLMIKVAIIIAISGACRCNELLNLQTEDIIQDENYNLIVNIRQSKTETSRKFPIINTSYIQLCQQYFNLRQKHTPHNRLFVFYNKGKCTIQKVGKNKLGQLATVVAKYLKLQDPELYTGHSFRRTSATLLANAGVSMTTLKCHGGWRSASVVEGYIENSMSNKIKVAQHIFSSDNSATTSNAENNNKQNSQMMEESCIHIEEERNKDVDGEIEDRGVMEESCIHIEEERNKDVDGEIEDRGEEPCIYIKGERYKGSVDGEVEERGGIEETFIYIKEERDVDLDVEVKERDGTEESCIYIKEEREIDLDEDVEEPEDAQRRDISHLAASPRNKAKEQLTNMRDCLQDALCKQRKRKIEASATAIRPWAHKKQMEFLKPSKAVRPEHSNIPASTEKLSSDKGARTGHHKVTAGEASNNVIDTPAIPTLPTQSTKKKKSNLTDLLKNTLKKYEERALKRDKLRELLLKNKEVEVAKENVALHEFFKSMYNLTKVMPTRYQRQIRRKVFAAVTEAEDEIYSQSSCVQPS